MIGAAARLLTGVSSEVPVDPDGDQARRWLIEELSKPEYRAARPTLWDQISQAFWDWLTSLQAPGGPLQSIFFVILVLVIAAVLVAAFLIFGRPRRDRTSSGVGALFGADEQRSARELRGAAQAAAVDGDWALAIEEMFRSIARRMSERVLVDTNPGTTARGFAGAAGGVFPEHAGRLAGSAAVFDGVRYLGAPGRQEDYRMLVALEAELRAARPESPTTAPAAASAAVST